MKKTVSILALITALPALADETRQLDAHEHGVGALNIAIDGQTVGIEFHAPGADIVGFEYAATSEEDRAAVDAAVATLARPLDLFVLPAEAACSVVQASAALESEEAHEDHEDHAHEDDHDHDKHEDHAEHDEHKHDHAEAEADGHTEFHAEYTLNCANPEALTTITFDYFNIFANAREVEVQMITSAGAQAFEVTREAPQLDLKGLL